MEQKNLLLAIIFSVAIMLGWQAYFGEKPSPTPKKEASNTTNPTKGVSSDAPPAPGTMTKSSELPSLGQADPNSKTNDQTNILNASPRIKINSPKLTGSISLKGAQFDDLTLTGYKETIEADSKNVKLLAPVNGNSGYLATLGWWSTSQTKIPNKNTIWKANKNTLSPENPVTLSWINSDGVVFQKIISLDDNYMFTVRKRILNKSSESISLKPYDRIVRYSTPDTLGFYILHEGLLGVFNGVLKEVDYDDLQETGTNLIMPEKSKGGWIGITDKYWLTAIIPNQKVEVQPRFAGFGKNLDNYQADFTGTTVNVPAGNSQETVTKFFAGAKEVNLVVNYRDKLKISRFDLAIDWGWFEWLTKPLFFALDYFNNILGNMGLSILLLTVIIKLIFFPLANTSYKAMAKMKALQPEMLKIRERFGEDRAKMNQEMMALYKREKANPASGCLPILPQIPVFFALYKVVYVTIELRHAPFFGWIKDLSAADPLTFVNLFGLINWTPPEYLVIGVWPIIMGATMYFQQKLNPPPPDPTQAKIFMFLPFIFTIMLARFPSGLVIYWAWNNALSILQQYLIMRKAGVPIGGGKKT
jgi:YidC/Oxa1 family membrane protein insertase|tara:strand:+ start:723 stop:2483 length:1761 start_codon:yes stop_codon:yes gene_type:complete